MPIDPSIIPHLSEALGAGYESIIHAVNGSPVQGGTRAAKSPKRKARRVKGGQQVQSASPQISGGKSRRRRRGSSRRRRSPTRKPRRVSRSRRLSRSRSRLSPSALRKSMVRSLARLLILRSMRRR